MYVLKTPAKMLCSHHIKKHICTLEKASGSTVIT